MGWVGSRFGVDGWMVCEYKDVKSVLSVLCVHWGGFFSFHFLSVFPGEVINSPPYWNLAMGG